MSYSTAVVRKDFLELRRDFRGSEKSLILEWIGIAHVDSMADVSEDQTLKVTIPTDDLVRWGAVSESNLTRDLHTLTTCLSRNIVELPMAGKGYWHEQVWVGAKLDEDTGEFTMRLNGVFFPYICDLKKNFRSFDLPMLFDELKGFYARKIYLMCRNELFHNSSWCELSLSVEEFKARLGLANMYPEWKILKRNVITPAIKEINNASIDVEVEVETKRKGRSIATVIFKVRKRIVKTPSLPMSQGLSCITAKTHAILNKIGYNNLKYIEDLAEEYGVDLIEKTTTKFYDSMKPAIEAKLVDNPAGIYQTRIKGLLESEKANEFVIDVKKWKDEMKRLNVRTDLLEVYTSRYEALGQDDYECLEHYVCEQVLLTLNKSERLKELLNQKDENNRL